jgi:3',5'-cyclic AMP phosphodiesterase CpdA
VHLSDLHFGRVDETLLAPLIERVDAIAPDLVVVSGDLTQRARVEQFRRARAFLDSLPRPQVVVPGNHDIPMHNVIDRFLLPLDKYRRHVSDNIEPEYVDDEIAVFGVNTARSATIKGGRINSEQIARLRARLRAVGPKVAKVVVTHHPFDLPTGFGEDDIVGRAGAAMRMFADCGVDLLLAGHLHASHAGDTGVRYPIGDYAAIGVQAGTATSTRGRGEANSFNTIRVDAGRIEVDRLAWDGAGKRFEVQATHVFVHGASGWSPAASPPSARHGPEGNTR